VKSEKKDFVKRNWRVITLLAVAAISRLSFLGLRPFDGDEGIILKIASSSSLDAVLDGVANDVHPPLFHILQYFDLKIFGTGEFGARILSALCAVGAIYVIFILFKKLSNEKTAFWVALLSIFSAILAYHAAEIRPYALFTLIFFGQLYLFILMLEKKRFWVVFGFCVLSALMILTQYLGFIILLGEGIYLFFNFKRDFKLKNVFALIAPMVLFALLWGGSFYHQLTGRLTEQSQSLSLKDNVIGLFSAIYRFGAGRIFLDLKEGMSNLTLQAKTEPIIMVVFVLSAIIPLLLVTLGVYKAAVKRDRILFVFAAIATPLILAALLSSEIGPRAVRYLSFLVPFYLYFIVLGYLGAKNFYLKGLYVFFALIFVAAYINGAYFERKKAGINTIAAYLTYNAKAEDAILIRGGYGGGEEWVLRFYLGEEQNEFKIYDMYGDYSVGNLHTLKARRVEDKIALLKDNAQTVWFYDMTYTFKTSDVTYSADQIPIGRDKEDKEIVLYKF